MMIGTDSHTPNAGGLGMIAIGVGGADAVDVMAGDCWGLTAPKLLGIKLTGSLQGWAAPKDLILKVAGLLTVKGGTGKIVEYFGAGAGSISCTGKATVTNMGAELGATTSVFPFDKNMVAYLGSTDRGDVARMAEELKTCLQADVEVESDPEHFFDEIIEIDLTALGPHWVGPHTPDRLWPASEMKAAVQSENFPDKIGCALIGSCTNSSYEDIGRAAHIAQQALEHGLRIKIPLLVTPGSDQVFQTIKRAGFVEILEAAGATILANACGPCIGQWAREGFRAGERNTIITSYNRNFRKRNDGNAETLAFIGSAELVTAAAFAGRLSFDPSADAIEMPDGGEFRFESPAGAALPSDGFALSCAGYVRPLPAEEAKTVSVVITDNSERLAVLEPFAAWDGHDFIDLPVLLKTKGKCTTDHISPAGPWLLYRGHLGNISDNMFLGAVNAFTDEIGKGRDVLSGEAGMPFPEIAKRYKSAGVGWAVIGDENYGEGSSREHAAMSPRFLGCKAVIVRSFARIHENNLKKQGVLALTFTDWAASNKIREDSRISIIGLSELAPDKDMLLRIKNGVVVEETVVRHTMTAEQIEWFRAGSALNALGARHCRRGGGK
jgi:aconitate hydratase